jgi:hypothetical protein
MKLAALLFLALVLACTPLHAQVYSNKVAKQGNQAQLDSLKQVEYDDLFPIFGARVIKKGFDLPYSGGLGVNYLWQESDLVIANLSVGFNNGPQYDLDEIIRMDDAVARASGANIRPDLWLFPFLDVYAILGVAKTSTEINAGLWIPDASGEWSEIGAFSSKADFTATSAGFGLTPTMGVRGGWMAFDMNFVWTDVSALDKPVYTYVFGPRLGKTFKLAMPERTVAFWVGGFRLNLSSSTSGSLKLSEVIPLDGLQERVDAGMIRVDTAQQQVDAWWNGLTPLEQRNPVNIARYETANRALGKAGNLLEGIDGALSDGNGATVQYSLEKRPKDAWNFVVGSQFQINKSWMIRGEYGFLGSRQQFIGGLQYRFGV